MTTKIKRTYIYIKPPNNISNNTHKTDIDNSDKRNNELKNTIDAIHDVYNKEKGKVDYKIDRIFNDALEKSAQRKEAARREASSAIRASSAARTGTGTGTRTGTATRTRTGTRTGTGTRTYRIKTL